MQTPEAPPYLRRMRSFGTKPISKSIGARTLGASYQTQPGRFLMCTGKLYDFYVSGDVVVVELSLNGTHTGPLEMPGGTIGATGEEFHAPCCDLGLLTETLQSTN